MAGILSAPDRFQIKLGNGEIVDLTRYADLTSIGTEYSAKFGTFPIFFDTMQFVEGAVNVCLLLGIDPSSVITEVKFKGEPAALGFNRFIDRMEIPNISDHPDGTTISIDMLKQILDPDLLSSMKSGFYNCFPKSKGMGVTVPSTTYMITTDGKRTQVAAMAMITSSNPDSLKEFRDLGAANIFNVCSVALFRQQGLAKSILVAMINNSIAQGINSFILEVDPENPAAKTLYTNLGFIKIGDSIEREKPYDVMYLTF